VMPDRLRLLVAGIAAVAVASAGLTFATADARPAAQAASPPKTTIALNVHGCSGCKVQPVQNDSGTISYWGTKKKVRHGQVTLRVPTSRTSKMAFLVYAPFDDYAEQGYPMVVVSQFKGKSPGARVTARFAGGTHRASGCWTGTSRSSVRNTLVVRHRQQQGMTVAAGWLRRSWESQRYWWRLHEAAYHVSDPSICA
jgi:hypothetical protein